MAWDLWKKGFDTWEDRTARLLEVWLKSPLVLNGSGLLLTTVLRLRAASDDAKARFWAELGLPSKRDQERTLHLLNHIQSRLLELEQRLDAQ